MDLCACGTFIYRALYCAGKGGRDGKEAKGGGKEKKTEKEKEMSGETLTEVLDDSLVRGLFLLSLLSSCKENSTPLGWFKLCPITAAKYNKEMGDSLFIIFGQ